MIEREICVKFKSMCRKLSVLKNAVTLEIEFSLNFVEGAFTGCPTPADVTKISSTDSNVTVASLGYPGGYDNDTEAVWYFRNAAEGQEIEATLKDLDVSKYFVVDLSFFKSRSLQILDRDWQMFMPKR